MAATEISERPKWTEIATALSTVVGGLALLFAAYQYNASIQQAKIDIAIRVIANSGPEIPYIPQYCLSAGIALAGDDPKINNPPNINAPPKINNLKKLHDREQLTFTSDAEAISIGKCLADLKKRDREEIYVFDNGKPSGLTPRGAALVAQRMNHALDKDEFIANLVNNGIADPKLLAVQYGWRLCTLDKPLAEKLYEVVEQKDALIPIRDYASTSCEKEQGPDGQHPARGIQRTCSEAVRYLCAV